jgi:hypothetical protein
MFLSCTEPQILCGRQVSCIVQFKRTWICCAPFSLWFRGKSCTISGTIIFKYVTQPNVHRSLAGPSPLSNHSVLGILHANALLLLKTAASSTKTLGDRTLIIIHGYNFSEICGCNPRRQELCIGKH